MKEIDTNVRILSMDTLSNEEFLDRIDYLDEPVLYECAARIRGLMDELEENEMSYMDVANLLEGDDT